MQKKQKGEFMPWAAPKIINHKGYFYALIEDLDEVAKRELAAAPANGGNISLEATLTFVKRI